jgi:hypothetical protein
MPDVAPQDDLKKIRKDFEKLGVQLLKRLNKEKAERKKYGKATLETGAKMDKLNSQWEKLTGDVKSVSEQIEAMKLDKERQAMHGGVSQDAVKTWIDTFIESEEYKAWQGTTSQKMDEPVSVGSMHKSRIVTPGEIGQKALTSTELGALVDEFRWQQIVADPLRPRRLLDVIPSVTVGSNAVEYPRENIIYEIVGFVETEAASAQADVILGTKTDDSQTARSLARGFRPGSTVVIAPGTGPAETKVIDSIDHATGTITLTTNLANTHAVGVRITSADFVFTPEANYKPQSEVNFELKTAAIKTLATWMPISRQMAEDSNLLRGWLETRMREFLELSREIQLLNGDGTQSDQIGGILNDSDIGTYLQSSGLPGDTKLDALRRSFTVVFLSFFPADAFVIHPTDWEEIETIKGSNGQYVFSQIQTGGGIPRVWRSVPIETPAIDVLTCLAGSFRLGCVMWDRMRALLTIADQHDDFRVRNLLLYLIEERLGFSVLRPAAFVKTTFDSIPV